MSKISVDKCNKKFASYKGILYNKDLKKVLAIPEGITEIMPAENCLISDSCYDYINLPKLKKLTIGSAWNELGESNNRQWWNPSVLKSIKIQNNNKTYFLRDGNLFKKNKNGKSEYLFYVHSSKEKQRNMLFPKMYLLLVHLHLQMQI